MEKKKSNITPRIKKIIINGILLLIVFLIFLLADILTKKYLFDAGNEHLYLHGNPKSNGFIGLRSAAEFNSIFTSTLRSPMPSWANALISIIISVAFITGALMSRSKILVVSIALVLAGVLGNTSDMLFNKNDFMDFRRGDTFIRSIFYIPWDATNITKTFNLADMSIFFGALMSLISLIIMGIRGKKLARETGEFKENELLL